MAGDTLSKDTVELAAHSHKPAWLATPDKAGTNAPKEAALGETPPADGSSRSTSRTLWSKSKAHQPIALESVAETTRGAPSGEGMNRSTEATVSEDVEAGAVSEADDPATSANRASALSARAKKHHRALVVGLLKQRVVWRDGSGCCDTLADFWFYLCQVHPLLCCFLAHPAHPFRRSERFVHLLIMLMLALFIAALSEVAIHSQGQASPLLPRRPVSLSGGLPPCCLSPLLRSTGGAQGRGALL